MIGEFENNPILTVNILRNTVDGANGVIDNNDLPGLSVGTSFLLGKIGKIGTKVVDNKVVLEFKQTKP